MVRQEFLNFNVMLRPAVVDQRQPDAPADRDLDDGRVESPGAPLNDGQGNFRDITLAGVIPVVVDGRFHSVVVIVPMDGYLGGVRVADVPVFSAGDLGFSSPCNPPPGR